MADTYRQLAEALLSQKMAVRALVVAKRSTELTPKSWEAHGTLGKAYAILGENALARHEYYLSSILGGGQDLDLMLAWQRSFKHDISQASVKVSAPLFNVHPMTCLPAKPLPKRNHRTHHAHR